MAQTLHILVVDDSAFARGMLRRVLEGAGHKVVEAEGGMSALEQYGLKSFDLIFLDQVMSDMNGLEVLSKLKTMNPEAAVILATADVQSATEQEARRRGAHAVLTKPFDRERVLHAVQAALEGGRK